MKKGQNMRYSVFGDVMNFVFLFIVAIIMLLPLIYAISNAFKPLHELFIFPPQFFVRSPTWDNFVDLFLLMQSNWVPFTRYIFNTVFITIVGTIGHVIIASMAAYALAKHRFHGQKAFFSLVVTTLMFSTYVTGIPNYLIMSKLNMIDTYFALILPSLAYPLGLFFMKQFMEQMIPFALLEAAKIDGASEWQVLWKIVMPGVKPAWLTLIIFVFQTLWNLQGGAMVFTESLKTLPYAMQQVVAGGIARSGSAAAAAVITMIVPIVLFIVTQSNIVETMATSGMKD